jgi:hypothetical protein
VEELLKILSLILISSVKFAIGPPLVYLTEEYDFTWLETNLYAILGGMIGVVFFMHFSDWLIIGWHKLRDLFRKKPAPPTDRVFTDPIADSDEPIHIHYSYVEHSHSVLVEKPKRRVFTPRTRRIVRIWGKYGLFGLAALTPILFSIPLGTFFMVRFEKNKRKILLYMFVSICSWSLILTSFFELTHKRNLHEIIR